jgi:hypothetical protein
MAEFPRTALRLRGEGRGEGGLSASPIARIEPLIPTFSP